MKKYLNIGLAIVTSTILLTGCSSSVTKVTAPVSKNAQSISINYSDVIIENSKVANIIPQEKQEYYEKKLEELFIKNGTGIGSGLKIKYSFMAFDEGNQALRYFVGFGAGKGELVVKTSFYDSKTDTLLGEIETKGELSIGAFGGSFDGTLEKVAEDVFTFTKKNYL